MIDLHYWPTPNGKKVTILLEECGLPYRIVPCRIGFGDQFKDEFLSISPNNRMPAMVDHEPAGGGEPIALFESGAIMIYIAEKAGRFYPQGLRARHEVNQWLIWQMANQGPKSGECGHFRRLGDTEGDQSYAVRRFTDEVNRLYGVMNNRLYDRRYLIGDEYTIADMICYPWTVRWQDQEQDIDDFPYFKRWFEELSARPGVQRGMGSPERPGDRLHEPLRRRARAAEEDALQPARPAGARGRPALAVGDCCSRPAEFPVRGAPRRGLDDPASIPGPIRRRPLPAVRVCCRRPGPCGPSCCWRRRASRTRCCGSGVPGCRRISSRAGA